MNVEVNDCNSVLIDKTDKSLYANKEKQAAIPKNVNILKGE
tara:strand:- start:24 stop:146 length:123 start_codon:yes stop_codon:yes gene_type:complete